MPRAVVVKHVAHSYLQDMPDKKAAWSLLDCRGLPCRHAVLQDVIHFAVATERHEKCQRRGPLRWCRTCLVEAAPSCYRL